MLYVAESTYIEYTCKSMQVDKIWARIWVAITECVGNI